jgi:hypothetical protein
MKSESNKSPFLLAAIAGLGAIVLGIPGAARLMGLVPNPISGIGTIEVVSAAPAGSVEKDLPQARDNVRGKWRCPECGVIVSMRGIGSSGPDAVSEPAQYTLAAVDSVPRGLSAQRFEFVVRLPDGSRRVIVNADSASWRLGEHVIVIDGAR